MFGNKKLFSLIERSGKIALTTLVTYDPSRNELYLYFIHEFMSAFHSMNLRF